jgi:ubiquitin-activating enzyme E1
MTESYSSTRDPPDAAVPMCLLHNFPNIIEHTIQWARDNFAGLFTIPAQQAEEYILDPKKIVVQTSKNPSVYDQNEIIDNITRTFVQERPKDFPDCIKWVSLYFPIVKRKTSFFFFTRLDNFSNNNFIIQ